MDKAILKIFPKHPGVAYGDVIFGQKRYPCALGKGGVVPAHKKREGDGATPAGLYWAEKVYYRPDREALPRTRLPVEPLRHDSGWCEDPDSPDYNTFVTLPHSACAETLWREDRLYDLVLIISHNRRPVLPLLGSAIFFHVARPGMMPTRGCVACERRSFLEILEGLRPDTLIRIYAAGED